MSDLKLRVHDAAPDRVEEIRRRCLSVLEGRRREAEVTRRPTRTSGSWVEPAIAFGLSALYLADAFARALALFR